MSAKQNIAVVGCGYWGKNLVRNMHEIGALSAVCDAHAAAADAMAKQYNVRALPYADALADSSIEGIVIAAPAHLHAELALQAFASGKHVLVEKPIALSVDEASMMIAAAKEEGKILMVGHLLQYHPAFLALKDLCDKGHLGHLKYIYSNRLNFGKIRTEENVFWSFAPHDLSMMLALAGREPVSADAHYAASLKDSTLASTATAHFDFGQDLKGHVNVSWLNPFKEQKLVVVGDRGMAVFDDTLPFEKKLAVFTNTVSFEAGFPVLTKTDADYIALTPGEALKEECLHFLHCMETGNQPRTDGAEALRVLKLLQLCDEAAGAA